IGRRARVGSRVSGPWATVNRQVHDQMRGPRGRGRPEEQNHGEDGAEQQAAVSHCFPSEESRAAAEKQPCPKPFLIIELVRYSVFGFTFLNSWPRKLSAATSPSAPSVKTTCCLSIGPSFFAVNVSKWKCSSGEWKLLHSIRSALFSREMLAVP